MATSSISSSASGGTNIDVASIVSQLMTVEKQPLTQLSIKQAGIQAKISAYGSVQGALSGFQSAMAGLADVSALQRLTASPSDGTVLSASTTNAAAPGSYSIAVSSLAQSEQLVATGQASQTASIGLGGTTTLTFDFGAITGGSLAGGQYTGSTFTSNGNGTKTVTINSANNSLQGIRDAINAANIGVTASIINDGSANPYRLSLSSNSAGANNSVKISVAGDAALTSLLAQDPGGTQNLSETSAAQNANFTVNGIAVSKSSNSVSDVISGVTLNLLKSSVTPVTLSVAQNTSAIPAAVNAFVKAYNDLHTAINTVTAYDPATQKGAVLQGDFAVNTVANQVRHVLNASVNNGGSLTSLADIGVTFQKDGTLAVDSTKLNTAMASNYKDIAALFGTVGTTSDSLINYTSAASATKPGSYAVNVTALATQGSNLGSVNLNAGLTTIAAGTTINVTLDGNSASVVLAAGTYTAVQLAAMVQSAINGAATFSSAGSSVAASVNASGFLSITSNRYGSASNIGMSDSVGSFVAATTGMSGAGTAGTDVAGTIDGQASTGSGQFLTSGMGDSFGIKIQINGGALGIRGSVNYSQGYAFLLNQYATSQLNSNGMLQTASSGLNKSITDIQNQQAALNVRLAAIQASYTSQFTALDSLLSSMNSTQQYLTQQLASLPKAN